MEVVSMSAVAVSGFQTLNALTSRKITNNLSSNNKVNISSHCLSLISTSFSHPNYLQIQNPRNDFRFINRCSIKPDIDSSDNAIEKNNSNDGTDLDIDSNEQKKLTGLSQNEKPISSISSRGLVFDMGIENSWDSQEIGSPVVKRFLSDEEERWYMWYHGRNSSNGDTVGLAVSSNGIHWERGSGVVQSSSDVGCVMNCSQDWWAFDTESIRPSEIVIMSSSKVRVSSAVYWLYYTGFNAERLEVPGTPKVRVENPERNGEEGAANDVFRSLPGLAISQDGRHWARIEGSFDELGVKSASVVRKRNGGYLMAYEGVAANGEKSIGLAESSDGLKDWNKCAHGAVLKPSVEEGGWDDKVVGHPCLVQMDGDADEWRLYYRGISSGGRSGIGMAISQGNDITSFRRWTGFHL
ncbi:hypothetical protein MKX03_017550 [Papaver bracteatum]|nr:hypothetical protein MKX03_017550 [Papaver bracteatum]